MSIFLAVLKGIGVLFLVILCLLLLLLLLLLFAPFRYKAAGTFQEKQEAQAKVNWLGPLVQAVVTYRADREEKLVTDLKIFGFSVFRFLARRRAKQEQKAARLREERRSKKQVRLQEIKTNEPARYEEMRAEAAKRRQEKEEQRAQEAEILAQMPEEGKPSLLSRFRDGISFARTLLQLLTEKVLALFLVIVHLPRKIILALQGLTERFHAFCAKISRKLRFYLGVHMRGMIRMLFGRGKKILKHILPRKLKGDLDFGFEDPSKTGYVLAACAALRPKAAKNLTLRPHFDEKTLKGSVELSGRVHLFYLLYQAARAYFNKNTRFVLRERKSLKEVPSNG